MAARMNAKGRPEPAVLRRHRPRQPDTVTPIQADAYYPDTDDLPTRPSWLRKHLAVIGAGMLLMAVLWYAATFYVLPFVLDKVDHWNTGEARISQFDLNVGHGGKSHFLTQYWQNQVVLIEIPSSDPTKAKVYNEQVVAIGDKSTSRVVTLTTAVINPQGSKDKPDIVASISGFAAPVIFYNTGPGFRTEAGA